MAPPGMERQGRRQGLRKPCKSPIVSTMTRHLLERLPISSEETRELEPELEILASWLDKALHIPGLGSPRSW